MGGRKRAHFCLGRMGGVGWGAMRDDETVVVERAKLTRPDRRLPESTPLSGRRCSTLKEWP
jgi:hypothetical protein